MAFGAVSIPQLALKFIEYRAYFILPIFYNKTKNIMKKIGIAILTIGFSILGFSQVIIGDEIGTATNKTSVLLEFANNQNKGIVLPYATTLPSGAKLAEGTILVSSTDATKAKVMYYNGDWQDLSSGNEADISSAIINQPNITESTAVGAIIGANSSSVDGVLVLESATKAMVLPQVNSTDDIIDPAPGMMVYINKTGSQRLAVFNGAKWTYWMP